MVGIENILHIVEIPYETGFWKDYHENGNLAAEGNYSKGEETGIWRYYDEDGNFEEEEDFG